MLVIQFAIETLRNMLPCRPKWIAQGKRRQYTTFHEDNKQNLPSVRRILACDH